VKPRYQSVPGTRDLFPALAERYAATERIAREVFQSYGYGEIRTPIFEHRELFARSVGETTDIVHKEMYEFEDRAGASGAGARLVLRPESTASVVRALVQRGLQEVPLPIRLWYAGPHFRRERPQKGRYREFRQIGVELFAPPSPAADAEVLTMLHRFLTAVGVPEPVLKINSLGTPVWRKRLADALREQLLPRASDLGEDDRRRLDVNPLRLFDSKDAAAQRLVAAAKLPALDDAARQYHDELLGLLAAAGVPFVEEPRLVRGLDYYTMTVFEVTSERLGAQNAILGGGRYDELVADLGGPVLSGMGFAIGQDRLIDAATGDPREAKTVFWVVPMSPAEFEYGLKACSELRRQYPEAVVELDLSGRGFKKGVARAAQIADSPETYAFKVADVRVAFIGPDERASGSLKIRDVKTREERTAPLSELRAGGRVP
jgi:histidyl-tRNA synthetase